MSVTKGETMKVFISHDSRDKKRFVKDFAINLLSKGIDVWYDDWELKVGDSLMKIFEDIPACDVFITVISKFSIDSKWVKEESDSAFIHKIENNMKFLPIIIMEDDFEIPNYLNHLVQCRIYDIDNYDSEFNRIVSDIYGVSKKPPIGNTPRYVSEQPITNLEVSDTIVFHQIGQYLLKNDQDSMSFEKVYEFTKEYELTREDVTDSLELLTNRYYISSERIFGPEQYDMIRLTPEGTIKYCENYINNFDIILKNIVGILLNEKNINSNDIYKKIDEPKIMIYSIVEYFSKKGYLEMTPLMGNEFVIHKITIEGKRVFKKCLL